MKTRKIVAIIMCAISLLCISSCKNKVNSGYYTFTDSLSNEVALPKKPERIVSLFGSFSETLLLSGANLVGVTADVIDENRFAVGENMQIVGTVKQPNIEKILSLNPDFIVLSADISGQIALAQTLKNVKIPFAYFHVESFDEYLEMLKIFTDITMRSDLYKKNGLEIKKQIEKTLDDVKDKTPPTALFLRVFSSGAKAKGVDNFVGDMLSDFGVVNIATKNPSLLTELSQEIIIKEDPDIILATSMGSEDVANDMLNKLLSSASWAGLSAVKSGKSYMLPKALFHYKPNAKWGEAYEYLKKILFPQ